LKQYDTIIKDNKARDKYARLAGGQEDEI